MYIDLDNTYCQQLICKIQLLQGQNCHKNLQNIKFKYSSQQQFDYIFLRAFCIMSGVISIEGNLGAGKSTFLQLLHIQVIKEPVHQWENIGGINILKQYYNDPKRWAFTFQINALHSRNCLWKKTILQQPDKLHYSERSPLADRHIFGQIMHREGNLDGGQFQIYDSICKKLIEECPIKGIIYLKCAPQICLKRIKMRNRNGEEGIPIQYLRKVHERYEEWLSTLENIPILVINTGQFDIYDNQDMAQIQIIINNFLLTHAPFNNSQRKYFNTAILPKKSQIQ